MCVERRRPGGDQIPGRQVEGEDVRRGVSFTPGAAPAGRACENWPVAYPRFPTMIESHTTPLICTVGSRAAVTVSSDGSVGAVSAAAGAARRPRDDDPEVRADQQHRDETRRDLECARVRDARLPCHDSSSGSRPSRKDDPETNPPCCLVPVPRGVYGCDPPSATAVRGDFVIVSRDTQRLRTCADRVAAFTVLPIRAARAFDGTRVFAGGAAVFVDARSVVGVESAAGTGLLMRRFEPAARATRARVWHRPWHGLPMKAWVRGGAVVTVPRPHEQCPLSARSVGSHHLA